MKKKIIWVLIAVAILGVALTAIPIMADPGTNNLDHVQINTTSATLVAGGRQQFTAIGYDINNTALSNVNNFWLVINGGGTINNTTGLFTASSTPGTYTNTVEVVAVQGTIVKLATATVTVVTTLGTLDHIQVIPTTVNIAPNVTQQFAAQGYDVNNVPIPGLTFSWSGVGTGGTISPTGLFTAGTTTGTFTVQASATQGTAHIGTATVNVTTTPSTNTTNTNTPKLRKNSLLGLLRGYLNNIGSDNFLGGQWQVKNGTGVDTISVISGIVQTASTTSITIMPNGQTTATTFTLLTSTVVQPKNTIFAANDKVMVVTTNGQVSMVAKISTPSTTTQPPRLNKQDDRNRKGKDPPPGWFHGNKNGWSK